RTFCSDPRQLLYGYGDFGARLDDDILILGDRISFIVFVGPCNGGGAYSCDGECRIGSPGDRTGAIVIGGRGCEIIQIDLAFPGKIGQTLIRGYRIFSIPDRNGQSCRKVVRVFDSGQIESPTDSINSGGGVVISGLPGDGNALVG